MKNGQSHASLTSALTHLWLQGEANQADPTSYACTFPAMIEDWRNQFHASSTSMDLNFPFGFVQLNSVGPPLVIPAADMGPNATDPLAEGWFPGIRWAQTMTTSLKNTFMAVVLDCPQESNTGMGNYSVHSIYKQPTGARLANAALSTAYGTEAPFTGPVANRVSLAPDGTLAVTFGNFTTGFEVRHKFGFEVFLPGTGWTNTTVTTSAVASSSATVTLAGTWPKATMVRFLWRNNPCALLSCPLYSDGSYYKLPAGPFWLKVSRTALPLAPLARAASRSETAVTLKEGEAVAGCPDKAMPGGSSPAELVKECEACITSAKANGCAAPKYCPSVTGTPWCGAAATTGCDTGPGVKPGSTTLECCQQYVNESVALQCSGKHECPDKQMSQRPYTKLTGSEVTALCEACFDLGSKTGCDTTHFCPEETGYPWCADRQLICDSLGPDHLTGVTAAMGRGCCAKYVQGNTSAACGGLPCPDDEAPDASKASCHACFASGAKVNCSSIAFCTNTKFGNEPWCGPSEPTYCTGKNVVAESGCDSLD